MYLEIKKVLIMHKNSFHDVIFGIIIQIHNYVIGMLTFLKDGGLTLKLLSIQSSCVIVKDSSIITYFVIEIIICKVTIAVKIQYPSLHCSGVKV